MLKIRTYYEHAASGGFLSTEESMTQQQFAKEADINYIVSQYANGVQVGNTGMAPCEPVFGDFSNLPQDAQEAYNQILEAKSNFDLLPVKIRERFNHDPAKFFAFVQDPANVDELVSLGLAVKTAQTVPTDTSNLQDNTDNLNDYAQSGQPTSKAANPHG